MRMTITVLTRETIWSDASLWTLVINVEVRGSHHTKRVCVQQVKSVMGTHLRATERHLPCVTDHTVLPATQAGS